MLFLALITGTYEIFESDRQISYNFKKEIF
jgi:hypothetical protein